MCQFEKVYVALNSRNNKEAKELLIQFAQKDPRSPHTSLLYSVLLARLKDQEGWKRFQTVLQNDLLRLFEHEDTLNESVTYINRLFLEHDQYQAQAKFMSKMIRILDNMASYECHSLHTISWLTAALVASSLHTQSVECWISFKQTLRPLFQSGSRVLCFYWTAFSCWMQWNYDKEHTYLLELAQRCLDKIEKNSLTQNHSQYQVDRLKFNILQSLGADYDSLKELLKSMQHCVDSTLDQHIIISTSVQLAIKYSHINEALRLVLEPFMISHYELQDVERFTYFLFYLCLHPTTSTSALECCLDQISDWLECRSRPKIIEDAILHIYCFFLTHQCNLKSTLHLLSSVHQKTVQHLLNSQHASHYVLCYIDRWMSHPMTFHFLRPLISLFSQEICDNLYLQICLRHPIKNSGDTNEPQNALLIERLLTALREYSSFDTNLLRDCLSNWIQLIQLDGKVLDVYLLRHIIVPTQNKVEILLIMIHSVTALVPRLGVKCVELWSHLVTQLCPNVPKSDPRIHYTLMILHAYLGLPNQALQIWDSLEIKCLQYTSLGWIILGSLVRSADLESAWDFVKKMLLMKQKLITSIISCSVDSRLHQIDGTTILRIRDFLEKVNSSTYLHGIVLQEAFLSVFHAQSTSFKDFSELLKQAFYGISHPALDEPHERSLAFLHTRLGATLGKSLCTLHNSLDSLRSESIPSFFYDEILDMDVYLNTFTRCPVVFRSTKTWFIGPDDAGGDPCMTLFYSDPTLSKQTNSFVPCPKHSGLQTIVKRLIDDFYYNTECMTLLLMYCKALEEGNIQWIKEFREAQHVESVLFGHVNCASPIYFIRKFFFEFLKQFSCLALSYYEISNSKQYNDKKDALFRLSCFIQESLYTALVEPLVARDHSNELLDEQRYSSLCFLFLVKAFACYLSKATDQFSSSLFTDFVKNMIRILSQLANELNTATNDNSSNEVTTCFDEILPDILAQFKVSEPTDKFTSSKISFRKKAIQYLQNHLEMFETISI